MSFKPDRNQEMAVRNSEGSDSIGEINADKVKSKKIRFAFGKEVRDKINALSVEKYPD